MAYGLELNISNGLYTSKMNKMKVHDWREKNLFAGKSSHPEIII